MYLSTHYYVLVLGAETIRLHEAFRDDLIDIENLGFPIRSPDWTPGCAGHEPMLELLRTIDKNFGQYYQLEPLMLVVVGDRERQAAFNAVTIHDQAIIGRIEGEHSATSVQNLGQIVWPIVKEAMSGVQDKAMRDLKSSTRQARIACGLRQVASLSGTAIRTTLLVEDGYHMRGRLGGTSQSPVISPDLDIRETSDDAVDAVIERILALGGNVVFTPRGSLNDLEHIVMLLQGQE